MPSAASSDLVDVQRNELLVSMRYAVLSKLPAAAAAAAAAAATATAAGADLATVDGREGAIVGRAVGKEGGALHLLDVVEAGDADERSVWYYINRRKNSLCPEELKPACRRRLAQTSWMCNATNYWSACDTRC